MKTPKKDNLVIYKGLPAVIKEVGKKLEIKLQSGELKKVREKDFFVIHNGPVPSLNFKTLECDIEETWTLLEGETVSLAELAEFLYTEDSPSALYNAYIHFEKKLYFIGDITNITCNSKENIDAELNKEKIKEAKALEFSKSIERLSKGEFCSDDETALREIEALALEQRTSSKILKQIGLKETIIDSHRFLIKIGYWDEDKNPYPGRMGVSLKSTIKSDTYQVVQNSLDLTHLKSYAIDDEGSRDPDDAVSIEGDDKIWIHITDVASIVEPGSQGDIDASAKGSNLYLPTQTVHMLPKEVTEIQALGVGEGNNNTLSFLIQFDENYNIIKREIHLARVKVERLTYAYVEENRNNSQFDILYKIASKLKERRESAGAISISLPEVKIRVDEDKNITIKPIGGVESRNVVSEFMLLAGESAALYCQNNNIPIPYATQQPPDAKGAPDDDLASMFMWRRKFKRGETQFQASPHAGLGLECYTRATSPLRRYSDLVVNQQIRAFILENEVLEVDDILLKVSPGIESGRKLTQCERASNLHWKLVYLKQNKELTFKGTFVEKKDKNTGIFLIEDLALECLVPYKVEPELNDYVDLKVKKIDIPAGTVNFSILPT